MDSESFWFPKTQIAHIVAENETTEMCKHFLNKMNPFTQEFAKYRQHARLPN